MSPREAGRRLRAMNIRTAIQEALERTSEEFIKAQQEQMASGKQSTGDEIQLAPMEWFPGYSPDYAKRRQREGLQTQHVDLQRTRAFYEEMQIEIEADRVVITSEVEYEKWITGRFGKKIWGLGGEALQRYRIEHFEPALRQVLTERTGLKFKV